MFNRSPAAFREQWKRPSNWFAVIVAFVVMTIFIGACLYLLHYGAASLSDKLRDIR